MKKTITGKISLYLLISLLASLIPFGRAGAQYMADGCYTQSGVPRSASNSQDYDFCYTADGSLTAITFWEYQANEAFSTNQTFNFEQPFGFEEIQLNNPSELAPAPTPEPTQQMVEKMPMMLQAVPLVGTPTKLYGKFPAQGDVYQSTLVTFNWEFDSVGVDTVPTSFTLVLNGIGYAVTPECSVSACQTTRTLAAGNYSWYVTAQSGTWSVSSNAISFSVFPSAAGVPGKPLLYGPSGNQTSQSVKMIWLPADKANTYTITWWGAANGSSTLPATDSSCELGACELAVGPLSLGSYSWSVTAVNASGSTASDPMNFTLAAATAAPAKPKLVKPNGSYTSSTVNFVFKPAANAQSYTVSWLSQWGQTGTKTLSASDATCLSGDCYVSDVMPSIVNFSWTVTAVNTAGSTKSDLMYYSIDLGTSAPVGYSPAGNVSNVQPFTYTFSKVQDNVYEYNVRVFQTYSNAQVADYYWNVSDLYCTGTSCSGRASGNLANGNYYWQVRARTNNSVGNWSSAVYFNTASAVPTFTPNTVPTPFSPIGLIQTPSPVFTWKPITGATAYWINVYDSGNRNIHSGYVGSSACNYQSCSYSPNFTLPGAGAYSWRVTGGTTAGVIWNHASATFNYQGQSIIIVPAQTVGEVEFISPADGGELYMNEARVIWLDQPDNNAQFNLLIKDQDGKLLMNTTLDRKAAWCDGETCTIEFAKIPLHTFYTLEITPLSAMGAAGEKSAIKFQTTDQELDFASLYPMENQQSSGGAWFSWRLPSNINQDQQKSFNYQIRLVDQTRNREAIMGPFSCDSENMICFNGGALFLLSDMLEKGQYQWGVQVQELAKSTGPVQFSIQ